VYLKDYQVDPSKAGTKYYSVKTGVDFVSTVSQKKNNKDLLEGNSIHAMTRSNLISKTMRRVGAGRFEARYQIEILSILFLAGTWDGIQVREIADAGQNEIWFPGLAIPSHGRAFVDAWAHGANWIDFWETNFARPMGRAKGEMMAFFGLQHMTSNAQNFIVAFNRTPNSHGGRANYIILRDIGDTLYNNHFFDPLKEVDPIFGRAWNEEIADRENGCVLGGEIGGGYFNPRITRIGAEIVFFYPAFQQGNLDTERDPTTAKILAKWCLAHNHGFREYFQEKVGYSEYWSGGRYGVPQHLPATLRRHAGLDGKNAPQYPTLANETLELTSATRWRLFREIEAEILSIEPRSKEDVVKLKDLVGAHELLICADIQSYIQSAAGIAALKSLHSGSAVPATPTVPPPLHAVAGPVCSVCRRDSPGTTRGWQTCDTCGSFYCGSCVVSLKQPRGSAGAMGKVRECRPPCKGITDEI